MRYILIATVALIFGCSTQKPQSVEGATVRLAAVSGNPSAAYFTVNGGPVADRLMTVSSPLVIRAEMHDMNMDGGMMKMAKLDSGVEVKAGGKVEFASGGKHVMLFDVSPKVVGGGKLPLVLTFASGAKLETLADVKAAGQE